jgi:hypothetical protein
MYSEPGRLFDLSTIEQMVQERTLAIGVKVIRNPNVKPKHVTGLSMERVVKKPANKKRRRKAA